MQPVGGDRAGPVVSAAMRTRDVSPARRSLPWCSRLLVAGILLSLGGCYSLASLRDLQPFKVQTVKGNYGDIAACMHDELRAKQYLPVEIATRPGERLARVAGVDQSTPRQFMWEITFLQHDADAVRVEWRGRESIFGTHQDPDRDGATVARCLRPAS